MPSIPFPIRHSPFFIHRSPLSAFRFPLSARFSSLHSSFAIHNSTSYRRSPIYLYYPQMAEVNGCNYIYWLFFDQFWPKIGRRTDAITYKKNGCRLFLAIFDEANRAFILNYRRDRKLAARPGPAARFLSRR